MMAIAEASTDPLNLGVLGVGETLEKLSTVSPAASSDLLAVAINGQVGGAAIGHDQRLLIAKVWQWVASSFNRPGP